MKFATKHELHKHMLVHADKNIIQCAVCGNKYRQPTNLRTHVKNAHNYSVGMNKENKCEYCGHAQNSLVGLHHHLLEDHVNQVQEQMEMYLKKLGPRRQNQNKGECVRRKKTPVEHTLAEIDILIKELNGEKETLQTEMIENIVSQQIVRKEPTFREDKESIPLVPLHLESASLYQLGDAGRGGLF